MATNDGNRMNLVKFGKGSVSGPSVKPYNEILEAKFYVLIICGCHGDSDVIAVVMLACVIGLPRVR